MRPVKVQRDTIRTVDRSGEEVWEKRRPEDAPRLEQVTLGEELRSSSSLPAYELPG